MPSRAARKQTVSITLESDLLARAREARLNISSISADAVLQAVKSAEAEKICAGIKHDMNWYADLISQHGCPAEAARAHFEAGDEPV